MKKIEKRNTVGDIESTNLPNGDTLLKKSNTGDVLSSFYYYPKDVAENKKLIKRVERLVRSSEEYKRYLNYLHENQNLHNDVVLANVEDWMATMEFHHYPFTLYNIAEIILNKQLKLKNDFTSYELAEEILQLHFENKIGVALLSKTTHDLVHAGKVYIPMDSVFGDVNSFVEEYRPYLFADQIDKFNILVGYSEDGPYPLPLPDDNDEHIELTKVIDDLPNEKDSDEIKDEIIAEKTKTTENEKISPFTNAINQTNEFSEEEIF